MRARHEMRKRDRLGEAIGLSNGAPELVGARAANSLRQRRGQRDDMPEGRERVGR
jgi:hypothetical protein